MKKALQDFTSPLRSWGLRHLPVVGLAALSVQPASAVKWVGPSTPTDFNSSANWNGGTVPGSGDQALFQYSANATLSSDITIGYVNASVSWNPGLVGNVTIDAGANTLTIDSPSSIYADASATGSATLNLKGNIALATSDPTIAAGATSRIVLDSATLSSSGAGFVPFVGGGTVELSNSSTASSVTRLIVNNATSLEVSGTSTVNGNLEVKNGSSLVVGGTSSLTVTGNILPSSGTPDSKWVIDLAGTSPDTALISATDIDVSDIALDLSNVPTYVSSTTPYVLATYSGTLTGNEFASVTGLGNNQIVYNFGPNANQIAIIPELSHAAPLLSGLLPLLMVRVRRRRGSSLVAK